MRVRVPCPGCWIMEIPSLGRASPVMITFSTEHLSTTHRPGLPLTTLLLPAMLSLSRENYLDTCVAYIELLSGYYFSNDCDVTLLFYQYHYPVTLLLQSPITCNYLNITHP